MSYWDEAMREAYEGWTLEMPERVTGYHRYRSKGDVARQNTCPLPLEGGFRITNGNPVSIEPGLWRDHVDRRKEG